MKYAVQTMSGYTATLELARWAESEGAAFLSVADHYLSERERDSPGLDQLVVLGGIARETTTLQISTLVSPLTFRHPAVMWKQAVTLDEMSGGRFSLGVGTGWMEQEHSIYGIPFPPQDERFDRLEEALGYLRAAMSDQSRGFAGRYYQLEAFVSNPRPVNLRLVVGGTGRVKTPTLAGRFADEFNVFPGPALDERIGLARHEAELAGRDPEGLLISTAFPDVVGRTQSEYEASLAEMAKERKRTPSEMAARLDEVGIPHGTPNQVAEKVAILEEAGISVAHLQVSRQDLDAAKRSWEVFAGS